MHWLFDVIALREGDCSSAQTLLCNLLHTSNLIQDLQPRRGQEISKIQAGSKCFACELRKVISRHSADNFLAAAGTLIPSQSSQAELAYTKKHGNSDSPSSKKARIESTGQSQSVEVDVPSIDTEQAAIRAAEIRVKDICTRCRFRRDITATAVAFMKRFFLIASPLEYPPHEMVGSCIFLAIKTDACPNTEVQPFHKRLVQAMGVREDEPSKLEMHLLMALQFMLTAHHPFDHVIGIIDMAVEDMLAKEAGEGEEREKAASAPVDSKGLSANSDSGTASSASAGSTSGATTGGAPAAGSQAEAIASARRIAGMNAALENL